MLVYRVFILLAFLLGGCVSVLPPESVEARRQLTEAVDALNQLDAAVAIPQADHSFRGLQPYYVTAIASLKSARRIADQRAADAQGRLSERPTKIAVQAIDNCMTAVDLLMQLNVTKALDPRDLDAFPVRSTCTIAKLIEGELNREAKNG